VTSAGNLKLNTITSSSTWPIISASYPLG
jgi:hypothetical protein